MSELTKRIKRVKSRKVPAANPDRIRRIITHDLEDWLAAEGDNLGVVTDEDMALVIRLLEASRTNNQRAGRFGSSSRGKCERRQVYSFLGMQTAKMVDPILQNIFNDGTFRHIRWQLMLMKAGIATDVEVFHAVPDWRLTTSLDAENDQYPWFLELKGWGGMKNVNALKDKDDIPPWHMLQMHTVLFATGWDTAIYVAEAKGTNYWSEVVVKRDERLIDEVKWELDRLNEAIEAEVLPPVKQECTLRRGEYKECQYAARCLQHKAEGSPWPEDERWPGVEGTRVQVGKRRRLASAPSRTG